MTGYNLPPGCTDADISPPPPECDECHDAAGEYEALGGLFCESCYDDWKFKQWLDHHKRLGVLRAAMFGRLITPPKWYDPESFEGRLLELEEEVQ